MPLNWKFSENKPLFSVSSETPEVRAARWEALKQQVALGTSVTGRVFIQAPFGVFFDAGLGFPVLINVTEFGTKSPMDFPDDYPVLDSSISGVIWGFDDSNRQVRVTTPANYANYAVLP